MPSPSESFSKISESAKSVPVSPANASVPGVHGNQRPCFSVSVLSDFFIFVIVFARSLLHCPSVRFNVIPNLKTNPHKLVTKCIFLKKFLAFSKRIHELHLLHAWRQRTLRLPFIVTTHRRRQNSCNWCNPWRIPALIVRKTTNRHAYRNARSRKCRTAGTARHRKRYGRYALAAFAGSARAKAP